MVSAHIDELADHPYSLSKLKGKPILVPELQRGKLSLASGECF